MPYDVQTSVFEGPFDLLLHLITKDKVDIYEVSLATIVDSYLIELRKLDGLDLEIATEFLLIASILVELKTRRLLPGIGDGDIDDEVSFWEERDLLLSRLLECKTFKDAAVTFQELMDMAERVVPRRGVLEEQFANLAPDPLAGLDPARLRAAFLRVTAPKKAVPNIDLFHVSPIRISVSDTVHELGIRLQHDRRRVSFREITRGLDDRVEIAVHFIAILELYKQGFVEIEQAENFAELFVSWKNDSEAPNNGSVLEAVADGYEG